MKFPKNYFLSVMKPKWSARFSGVFASTFLAALTIMCLSASAQTFRRVTHLSGSVALGGNTVTVSSSGFVSEFSTTCGGVNDPYVGGNDLSGGIGVGGYLFSFAAPTTAVRLDLESINIGDIVTIYLNGVMHPISLSDLSALSTTCLGPSGLPTITSGTLTGSGLGGAATVEINPGFPINTVFVEVNGGGLGVVHSFYFADPSIPSFTGGATQSLAVCQDASATDINSLLEATYAASGETLTWSTLTNASHGTLVSAYTTTSTGGNELPTGLSYTPATGYIGADTFSVVVDNGNGGMDTTMVYVTVKPTPDVAPTADQTICHNTNTTDVLFGGTYLGTTFNWTNSNTTIGLAASASSGDILNFTGVNTNTAAEVAEIIVTPELNGCTGANDTFTITVNPIPDVIAPANATFCGNDMTTDFLFTGAVSGTTFNWSVDNDTIGFAASGTGDILTTMVVNNSGIVQTAIFTVTPVFSGCTGTAQTFTVSVKPAPNMPAIANQAVCDASSSTAVVFTADVTGTTFAWTNSDTSIGLVDAGTTNIAAFTVTNTTFVPKVATITVTPTADGCIGAARSFTITANPTPDMVVPLSQTWCNNDTTDAAAFSGNVAGTSFDWTNSETAIGLGASGSGNISRFVATNSTTGSLLAIISATPNANGCAGITQAFTYNIKPSPSLTSLSATVCDGILFNYYPASATTGTIFNSWVRDTADGIANTAAVGIDTVSETLVNVTADPANVHYVYSMSADGCTNTQTVTVTVNPTPVLTSTLTGTPICSNGSFMYTPASATIGTSFSWNRDTIVGITPGSTFGTDDAIETLGNLTASPITVTYLYTLLANSCTNTQSVTVVVKPTPTLSSSLTPGSVCDSSAFSYVPTSATTGTTYAWNRATVVGISNPAGSGIDTVADTLVNTTVSPVGVVYSYTLTADGCENTQDVALVVNPRVVLTSTLTPPAICDNDTFSYMQSTLTTGASFTWSRDAITGISNPAASGSGNISEVLNNTTASPITVVYVDTANIAGCIYTESISVVVNPTPVLATSLTPPAICDSSIFSYNPASATIGTTFSWDRPFVSGLGLLPGSGTDNPNEQLLNTTYVNVNVDYVYSLSANGCTNTQTVTVAVRPTPILSSAHNDSVCSGSPYTYLASSYTPSSTLAWSRAAVSGITPTTKSGTGNITDTLTVSADTSVTAVYIYTLTVSGCSNTERVTVKVNPAPGLPTIAIMPPTTLCYGTTYQNFGASTPQTSSMRYTWTATNATVNAVGATRQNCIVSFPNPGQAVVTLAARAGATSCTSRRTYTVNVGNDQAQSPEVIYYNGQFICLQNDVDSYQWGFDDVLNLDSTLLAGEINQNYFANDPDLAYRYYWVMTVKNGCTQKTYYNVPVGVTDLANGTPASIKLFPNPATEEVNIQINADITGAIAIEVSNMVGQKVASTQTSDKSATINVASLPAGYYLVNCYANGVKVATAKFVKN